MEPMRFAVTDRENREVAEIIFRDEDGLLSVERSAFINSFRMSIDRARMEMLIAAASRKDWASLNAFDPEFLPWFCPKCGCNFAADAWSVRAVFDDTPGEHWLDSYRGVCPNGHERMVAD